MESASGGGRQHRRRRAGGDTVGRRQVGTGSGSRRAAPGPPAPGGARPCRLGSRLDRRRATSRRGSSKSAGSGSQSGATDSGSTGLGRPPAVGRSSSRRRRQKGIGSRRARARPGRVRERLRLVEPETDHAADRIVADSDAVERVGRFDGPAVVGDHDELGLVREASQRVREPADVRLVERGVDLVEHAERHGPDLEHREQQRHGRQGALTAGEHREGLRLLPRRTGDDLDARRSEVRRIRHRKPRETTAEQLLEPGGERDLECLEGRSELVGDHRVELGDQLARPDDRGPEVGVLRFEAFQSCLELCVLIDRVRIDRTEVVKPPTQLTEPGRTREVGQSARRAAQIGVTAAIAASSTATSSETGPSSADGSASSSRTAGGA